MIKNRAVPYRVSLYRLNEISSKYDRFLTLEEHEKRKIQTKVFYGTDCISKMLHWVDALKGKPRKVEIKKLEYELQ